MGGKIIVIILRNSQKPINATVLTFSILSGIELGIADTNLIKAVAQTTGRSTSQIKTDIQEVGDIGLVAEKSKSNQRMLFKPARLTVKGVFDKLKDIAKMTGHAVSR